jgi:hypothetical protein
LVQRHYAALPTHSGGENRPFGSGEIQLKNSEVMSFFGARFVVVLLCVGALAGLGTSVRAQGSNPDQKPPEQKAGGEAGKTEPKKIDVIAESAKRLTGPAANPECTWIGVRVARLLYQDDLDTAFRHLDIYDRFGCPGNHIQATFRCLAKLPEINPKTDTLNSRVNDCWLDPTGPSPAAPAAQTNAAPSAPTTSGAPAPASPPAR